MPFLKFRLKIIKSVCFFIFSFFISSCTPEKLQNCFLSPWDGADRPQNIIYSGKKNLQDRNYTEARKFFDQIVDKFPDSPEAEEARFYRLLIDFMNGKKFPSDSKRIFPEKFQGHSLVGFYTDFEAFLFNLVKELKRRKSLSKNFEKTIELQKQEIKDLQVAIAKSKKKNSKINEEVIKLNHLIEKIKIDYQKVKTALEKQRNNYRKMQQIEMRKEEMERELREISQ